MTELTLNSVQTAPSEVETQGTEASVGPTVIKADNPSEEEMKALCEHVKERIPMDVEVKPVAFKFKKSKDKDTGLETVREAVELAVPYPSAVGLVKIIEVGGKQLELLMEAAESVINSAVRDHLNEDYKLNATNFPYDKVSWEAIANLPKAQRRGGGIPKEVWEAFGTDYCEVMPAATGKNLEQVGNAAKILMGRLSNVRTNKPVLEMLVQQLAIYAGATQNLEDFQEVIDFLADKADSYLNLSDEDLLANL